MSKKSAHEIYHNGLHCYKRGFAQWHADPHTEDEIQIGDVGYIEEGKFNRVMSIDLKTIKGGVRVKKGIDTNHIFTSQSVKASDFSVDAQCQTPDGTASAGAKLRVSCSSEEGAFLMLVEPDKACPILVEDADYQSKKRMENFLKNHYKDWLNDPRFEYLTAEQLVLITGTSKCRDWIAGVFSDKAESIDVSLSGGIFDLSSVSAEYSRTHIATRGLELNRGHLHPVDLEPNDPQPTGPRSHVTCKCQKDPQFKPHRNQCIFFRGLTLRKSTFGLKVIKAAAVPQDFDENPENDDDLMPVRIDDLNDMDVGTNDADRSLSTASNGLEETRPVHNGNDDGYRPREEDKVNHVPNLSLSQPSNLSPSERNLESNVEQTQGELKRACFTEQRLYCNRNGFLALKSPPTSRGVNLTTEDGLAPRKSEIWQNALEQHALITRELFVLFKWKPSTPLPLAARQSPIVKVWFPSKKRQKLIKRELLVGLCLCHENILPFLRFFPSLCMPRVVSSPTALRELLILEILTQSIKPPEENAKMAIALGGHLYLHRKVSGVPHRDLRGANVLINGRSNQNITICDFGLSPMSDDPSCHQTGRNSRWQAPELFETKYASDISAYRFAYHWPFTECFNVFSLYGLDSKGTTRKSVTSSLRHLLSYPDLDDPDIYKMFSFFFGSSPLNECNDEGDENVVREEASFWKLDADCLWKDPYAPPLGPPPTVLYSKNANLSLKDLQKARCLEQYFSLGEIDDTFKKMVMKPESINQIPGSMSMHVDADQLYDLLNTEMPNVMVPYGSQSSHGVAMPPRLIDNRTGLTMNDTPVPSTQEFMMPPITLEYRRGIERKARYKTQTAFYRLKHLLKKQGIEKRGRTGEIDAVVDYCLSLKEENDRLKEEVHLGRNAIYNLFARAPQEPHIYPDYGDGQRPLSAVTSGSAIAHRVGSPVMAG